MCGVAEVDAEHGVGELDGGAHPDEVLLLFKAGGHHAFALRREPFERADGLKVGKVDDIHPRVGAQGRRVRNVAFRLQAPTVQRGDDAQLPVPLVQAVLVFHGAGHVRRAPVGEGAALVGEAGDLRALLRIGAAPFRAAGNDLPRKDVAARHKNVVLRNVHRIRVREKGVRVLYGKPLFGERAYDGIARRVRAVGQHDVLHGQAVHVAGGADLRQVLRLVGKVGVIAHGEMAYEQEGAVRLARGDVAARNVHPVRKLHGGGVGYIDARDLRVQLPFALHIGGRKQRHGVPVAA